MVDMDTLCYQLKQTILADESARRDALLSGAYRAAWKYPPADLRPRLYKFAQDTLGTSYATAELATHRTEGDLMEVWSQDEMQAALESIGVNADPPRPSETK